MHMAFETHDDISDFIDENIVNDLEFISNNNRINPAPTSIYINNNNNNQTSLNAIRIGKRIRTNLFLLLSSNKSLFFYF